MYTINWLVLIIAMSNPDIYRAIVTNKNHYLTNIHTMMGPWLNLWAVVGTDMSEGWQSFVWNTSKPFECNQRSTAKYNSSLQNKWVTFVQ